MQVSLVAGHFKKSPEFLGPEEIRSYLTNHEKLASSSIKVAVAALRFLYRATLGRPCDLDDVVPTPKNPQHLPVFLSPAEVVHFLGGILNIKRRTILATCLACGSARPFT